MTKLVARNAYIYAGAKDISGKLNTVTLGMSVNVPEVTTFGSIYRERLTGGMTEPEMGMSGFYDGSASDIDNVCSSLLSVSSVYGLYFNGASLACPGRELVGGVLSEYNVNSVADSGVALAATVIPGSGALYTTNVLYNASMSSANGASTAFASASLSSSPAASAVCVWRVFKISGASAQISASLQHSGDDLTFSTIYEFTAASLSNSIYTSSPIGMGQYRRVKVLTNVVGEESMSVCMMFSAGSMIARYDDYGAESYLLLDDFSDWAPAGSVHGTPAYPGPG